MILRRAGADDIPAMSRIRLAVRENALSNPARITEAMYREYLDEKGRAWVAVDDDDDGAVIAFSTADRTDGSIWALFTDPAHEGRGAGGQLLRLAVDWLFEIGFEEVRLGTAAHTRADRFYAAQGWTREGMRNDVEVGFSLRRDASTGRSAA